MVTCIVVTVSLGGTLHIGKSMPQSPMLTGLLAAALLVAAAGRCEPFCDNPCDTMNGNVEQECASCQPPVVCRPGAADFSAGGITDTQEPTPVVQGIGGDPEEKKDVLRGAAAPARRLSPAAERYENETARLRAVGWESSGWCMLPRVPVTELRRLPLDERIEWLASRPMVVTGALESWPPRADALIDRVGQLRVRVSHCGGHVAAHRAATVDPSETADAAQFIRMAAVSELQRRGGRVRAASGGTEWAPPGKITLALHDHINDTEADECALHDAVADALGGAPPPFEHVTSTRYLSIGGYARPHFSRHHVAWLGMLSGSKAVFVAAGEAQPADCTSEPDGRCLSDWCSFQEQSGEAGGEPWPEFGTMLAAAGVSGCVLGPGEIIHLPDRLWHVTCNLASDTVAWGGQGWDPDRLLASGATAASQRTNGLSSPCHSRHALPQEPGRVGARALRLDASSPSASEPVELPRHCESEEP